MPAIVRRTSTSVKKNIRKSDLKVIGTLGKGSFGHVQLVKDKENDTYALKSLSKSQVVQLGQQEHVMSEKNVMDDLDCMFLVNLVCTYKDRDWLYFLMEVCLGGELFSVLRQRTVFDEPTAMFFRCLRRRGVCLHARARNCLPRLKARESAIGQRRVHEDNRFRLCKENQQREN